VIDVRLPDSTADTSIRSRSDFLIANASVAPDADADGFTVPTPPTGGTGRRF
jgi:hypothetical protein